MSFAAPTFHRATLSRRVALLVAIAFAATSVAALAHPSSALAWGDDSFSSSAERQLIALTNQSRAAAGRKALKVSSTLTSIARWRSKDMIVRDYFSHSIPGYGKVFTKMSAVGFCYNLAGENIGWINGPDSGATSSIHQMFMDSSGHRENILGKAWDVIGVGAYKGADGKKMYTVLFADKCGSTKATTKSKPKPKPTTKPRQVSKPRATARPKPKATPRPTPAPTPFQAPVTERAEPSGDALPGDLVTTPTPATTEPPGLSPGPAAAAENGHRLRVASPPAPDLVDAIAADVTGSFLGP